MAAFSVCHIHINRLEATQRQFVPNPMAKLQSHKTIPLLGIYFPATSIILFSRLWFQHDMVYLTSWLSLESFSSSLLWSFIAAQ